MGQIGQALFIFSTGISSLAIYWNGNHFLVLEHVKDSLVVPNKPNSGHINMYINNS